LDRCAKIFGCGLAPLDNEFDGEEFEFVSRVKGVPSEVEVVAECPPAGDPVSSSGTVGDKLPWPIGGDIRVSFRTGTGFASGEKNVVTNVYSAVVLSIRTRSADRRSDSIGAFCRRARIIRVRNENSARRETHVVLIVAHVSQSDSRPINSGVLQP
jgi:hypothetical protein